MKPLLPLPSINGPVFLGICQIVGIVDLHLSSQNSLSPV